MKTAERELARRLRREQGLSMKEIELMVGVSRSSVSQWVRDIELTPEQYERLREQNPALNLQRTGQARWASMCRERRARAQAEGRVAARRGESLHAIGCMLYWGKGSKSDHLVQLANSDVHLLRLFLRFLRTYFRFADEKVRVQCHLYSDHVERQTVVEQYWLDALGLPRACLTKSQVNVYSRSSARKRRNVLPYGTCRLTVCDVTILQHIYGAIQEYGGFERPEWLR